MRINIYYRIKKIALLSITAFVIFAGLLYSADSSKKESIDINDYIMEELTDNTSHPFMRFGTVKIKNFTYDIKLTKHMILIFMAAVLTVSSMKYLEYKLRRPFKRPTYIQSVLEMIVDYMSKEVFDGTLGEHGKKYIPFCLTVFFFVFFANFLGLFPPLIRLTTVDGGHAYLAGGVGANLGFTIGIATIVFVIYNIAGMREKGVVKYWLTLAPSGLPIPLIPLLWVLEFVTLLNRSFALAIRLFANITGGHIMLMVIPYLIVMSGSLFVAPLAVGFLGFIYLIEILVAVLQAYVFALLSAVYIGLSVSEEH